MSIIESLEEYKKNFFKNLESNTSGDAPGLFFFSILFIFTVAYWWVRDFNLDYVSWHGPVTSRFIRPNDFLEEILDNLSKPDARIPIEGWPSFFRALKRQNSGFYCRNYISPRDAEDRLDWFIGCFMDDPVNSVWYNLQDMLTDIRMHGFNYGFLDFIIQACLMVQLFWYFYLYNLPTAILIVLNCQLATFSWVHYVHYYGMAITFDPSFRSINIPPSWKFRMPSFKTLDPDNLAIVDDFKINTINPNKSSYVGYNTFEFLNTARNSLDRIRNNIEYRDFNGLWGDLHTDPTKNIYLEPYKRLMSSLLNFLDRWTEMRAVVDENYIQYVNFHIDPISLFLVKYVPFESNPAVRTVHILVYEILGPIFTVVFVELWFKVFNILFYVSLIRRFKKILSYLVRWHYTKTYFLDQIFPYIVGIMRRCNDSLSMRTGILIQKIYQITHESPYALTHDQSLEAIEDIKTDIIIYMILQSLIMGSIYVIHIFFILSALHAACGQYYYIPWLTLNVEMHVGPRGKVTIYNSGLMDWQKYDYSERTFSWYGLFGRGRDKESILSVIFDFIKSRFIKLFKKFMSFFKND